MAKITDIQVAQKMVNKRADASARGIKYDMSFKRTKQLMKQKTCFYTGIAFSVNGVDPRDPLNMTFDRVDSNLGYVDSNVVACTYAINQLKANLSPEQITQLYKGVQKVIKRNDKKNPNRLKPVALPKIKYCKFKKDDTSGV